MNFITSVSLGLLNLFFYVLSPIIQANLNGAELSAIHLIALALTTVFFVVGAAAHMKILTECPKLAQTDWQFILHGVTTGASLILIAVAWLNSLCGNCSYQAESISLFPRLELLLAFLLHAGFVINDIHTVAKGVQAVERAEAAESYAVERELGSAEAIRQPAIVADARNSGKVNVLENAYEDVRSSAGILESVTQKFGSEREAEAKDFAKQIVAMYVEQFEREQLTNESARIVFESVIDYTIIFRAEKILRTRGWRLSMIDQQSFILGPCAPPEVDGFAGVFSL